MIKVVNEMPSTVDVEKACNTYGIDKFEVVNKKNGMTYFMTCHTFRGYSLCDKRYHMIEYPFENEHSWRSFIRKLNNSGYEVYIKTEEDN